MNKIIKIYFVYVFISIIFSVRFFFLDALGSFYGSPSNQCFDEYYSLDDWDLPVSRVGDFDFDGYDDLITHTGCAFLSSMNETKIPEQAKCRKEETDMGFLNVKEFFEEEGDIVGQNYFKIYQSTLENKVKKESSESFYSYLGLEEGENWKLYVDYLEKNDFVVYTISQDGSIKLEEKVPFRYRLNHYLYKKTDYFFSYLLLMPFTIPVILLEKSFVLPYIFKTLGFKPYYGLGLYSRDSYMPHILIFLTIINVILYFVWKKSKNKKKNSTSPKKISASVQGS